MWGESTALQLLEDTLSSDEADAVEGYFAASDNRFTRLANTEVTQDSAVRDASVVVRTLFDGRLGTAVTHDVTPSGLEAARHLAALAARSLAGKPFPAGFLGKSEPIPRTGDSFDEETATLSPEARKERLATPLEKAEKAGLLLAGNCHTGCSEIAIWNTLGLARYFRSTRAEANFVALEGLEPGQSTGYAGDLSPSFHRLDVDGLADVAIEKAQLGRVAVELEPDAYDVILEPAAVAEILEWLSYIGFNSRAVNDKTSFMSGKLGQRITGEMVTLVDDGLAAEGMQVPFDVEGTPKLRTVLIERGVARSHVYDRHYGHLAGEASTGHAVEGLAGLAEGARPTNLLMARGYDTEENLLASVERGLWVTRFHYVNGMLEPKRAVMTGLTRDGTFLIENGRITKGVKNLRFTDSILEAFERVAGITAKRRTVGTWWTTGYAVTAPTILVRDLRFTGKTSS